MNRHAIGMAAEDTVRKYITNKGYTVLAHNYRANGGEIDIIATKCKTLVFIEVKARAKTNYGNPCEAVGHAKQARIRSAAQAYLVEKNITNQDCRFDVVELMLANNVINHIKDAFY